MAFDGDGDRLGVVTAKGDIIFPDRQLMLFARTCSRASRRGDHLRRQEHAKSRSLDPQVRRRAQPVEDRSFADQGEDARARRGASREMSGHTFFVERWYGFDDAQYAGARLLEILSKTSDATAALTSLPDSVSTPELHIKLGEGEPHRLIALLQESAAFPGRPR